MLILMSLALAPLGIIASIASIETAEANRDNREIAAHLLAGDSADQLNLYLDRAGGTLRAVRHLGRDACRRADDALSGRHTSLDNPIRVAVFNDAGRLVCADPGLTASLPVIPPGASALVALDSQSQAVRVIAGGRDKAGWALAVIPAPVLASVGHPKAIDGSYSLSLVAPGQKPVQLSAMAAAPIGRDILTDLPIAGGQIHLRMDVVAAPLSANELLLTFLPILMWVAGAAIGWIVTDRLLVRPLGDMQAAIDRYRGRGGRFTLPTLNTPAQEIRDLGDVLSRANETIAQHETDLEDGLARQTRLTREVHHRVKNNLQVVASLLNIHARGADTAEAAAAYATIQRRVEALAIVHRSHYAELEVNRGVALRPLIGELASNLRGSMPEGLAPPQITLDLAQRHANQDIAVSVAFLITEVIEAAMLRMPGAAIAIRLAGNGEEPPRARLAISSSALTGAVSAPRESAERFDRVIIGLSRQLRATLERDEEAGLIAVEIAVIPESGEAEDEVAE